jgi:hypothetical protein
MEKIMLDKITDNEYTLMHHYRDWYAWSDSDSYINHDRTISVRSVLEKVWAKTNQTLFNLLGNELIISKELSFEKSEDELYVEFCEMFDDRKSYGREGRTAWEFRANFWDWFTEFFPIYHDWYDYKTNSFVTPTLEERAINEVNIPIREGCAELMSYTTLSKNRYEGPSFTVELREGRKYTVSTGCKPMKALAKIAEAHNIEGFEDFRICHSLVLNQKKSVGELCLSIHPMDYWTMSDNDCDWDSCMNWREQGGYRAGTVEMMNSPCVVVAYLKASDPFYISRGMEWNNKKWRQLFIVNEDVIMGIKDYPYHNPNIGKVVNAWLKELAEKNLGWKYCDKLLPYHPGEEIAHPNYPDEKKFAFYFHTNDMYNDTGCCNHYIYIRDTLHESGKDFYSPTINYSGKSQCVSCGEIDIVLFFRDPLTPTTRTREEANVLRLCDVHNIPIATNIAMAEVIVMALDRGDLDWIEISKK